MTIEANNTTVVADVLVHDEGTVVSFAPLSESAWAWFDQYVQYEPWQFLGNRLIVDHRPAEALLLGLSASCLNVLID